MTHAKQLATFTTSTVIEFVLGVTFANGSAAVNGQPFAQQPPVAEVFLLDRVPWTNCLMLPSGAETCLEDRACRKKRLTLLSANASIVVGGWAVNPPHCAIMTNALNTGCQVNQTTALDKPLSPPTVHTMQTHSLDTGCQDAKAARRLGQNFSPALLPKTWLL